MAEDFNYSIYGDKDSIIDSSIKMSDQTPTKKGLTEKEIQVISKIRLILSSAGFEEKEEKDRILRSYTPKPKSEDVDLRALQNAVNAHYKEKNSYYTSMGAPNVFEINSQIEKNNKSDRQTLVEEKLLQQRSSQGGRTSKRQRKNRSSRRSLRRIRRTRRRV